MREYCETVIELFDSRIDALYDPEDRENRTIQSTNRQGEKQTFNLMSLTLAVVTSQDRDFDDYREMTETAAEVKKFAKQDQEKSNYFINRRNETNPS
jgi:hypothetical protein